MKGILEKEARSSNKKPPRKAKAYAKLTWAKVRNIRRAYAEDDVSTAVLSRKYGVAPGTILAIVGGRTWNEELRHRNDRPTITEDQAAKVRELRAGRMRTREIATATGLSLTSVCSILNQRGRFGGKPPKRPRRVVTPEEVAQVRDLLAKGVTQREVARVVGVSQGVVWRIANGKDRYSSENAQGT